jgi:hypothetical protein
MTRQFLTALGLLLLLEATAVAQSPNLSLSSFDPEQATAPIDMVEGNGIKVGEGTTLHPVFGAQTGVLSNVFYEEADTTAAGVLRISAQVGVGSLTGLRLVPAAVTPSDQNQEHKGSFEYRAELRAAYDFLLSSNDAVWGSGGLGLGATLRGMTNPSGTWSFGFNDNFTRLIRAANFETDANTNRDINTLSLNLLYHPQGRSLAFNLYYNNVIDIFERGEQSFADRWMHRFGVRPMWRWLPETVLYADFSWGVTAGLGGDSMKNTSYPLQAVAGVATLFSAKTSLNLQAGYVNGFYSAGPSYSSVTVSSQLGYRYSPLGRATVAYSLIYNDSVNANYYRDHVVQLNIEQLFAPLVFMVQPELHFRRYEGTLITGVNGEMTRDDVIFSVIAGIHYNFRNSLAATLDYHFSTVQTDFSYMVDTTIDDPGFSRHELLAGVRWAL